VVPAAALAHGGAERARLLYGRVRTSGQAPGAARAALNALSPAGGQNRCGTTGGLELLAR
jgi:hypothetical protein